jgi:quinolinate synthase
MSLKSKCDQYDVLVKELFMLLDITEETDDGRVFRPNQISSCRAMDAERLDKVLTALKHTMQDFG